MAVLAERAGGRVDQVAFAQSFRILVVVLTIPFIYTYGGIHGLDRYAPVAVPVSAPSLLLLFALTALGGFVLTVLKRPNPFMLGPLFVAIGMTASGVELSAMPAPLSAAGQLLLGCALGAKFEQSFFRTAPRFMGAMLAATVTAMLFTSAFAWFVIGKLGGVPVATGVLAVAPGGIAEMCITAKTLQLGVPVVTAFHVGRVIILVLLADLAYRFSSRLSGRGRG
jgi:uncharacterized protein